MADADGEFRLNVLLDVHEGLPRQGPGDTASTLRALAACTGLARHPEILDVGCGPGMQTRVLAAATGGRVVAVDLWPPFLRELRAASDIDGTARHILPVAADMAALPFADGVFDLIWSEGAAYSIGFEDALSGWRRLLKPRGLIAVSELVWLTATPPRDTKAFFERTYPGMADVRTTKARIVEAGYAPIAVFTLPDSAWWRDYYRPLARRLDDAKERWKGDEGALAFISDTAEEIAQRRRNPDSYGYAFLVGRRTD